MIRASFGKTSAGRLLLGAGVLALLIPAIAGCEAGENAPTLEFHPASAGAQTVFNGIKITDAFVLGAPSGSTSPAGSSVGLFLSLFNNGTSNDELVSASAPGSAASVTIDGGTVALPSETLADPDLTGPKPLVVLKNLSKPLTGGTDIPVTLDFEHAGSVTIQVPVMPQSYDFSTYSPPASPVATASSTSSATPSIGSAATSTASATPAT